MLASQSRHTSFSKLESNTDSVGTDVPTTVVPPPIQDPEIGAVNRSAPDEIKIAFDDQGYDRTDYSERYLVPRLTSKTVEKSDILRARQRWQGTVTEVGDSGFTANLTDMTNPENPVEEATFRLNEWELPDDELALIKRGATLYWIVGTEESPAGTRKNVSMLRFQRTPRWTRSALERAKAKAGAFESLFEPIE